MQTLKFDNLTINCEYDGDLLAENIEISGDTQMMGDYYTMEYALADVLPLVQCKFFAGGGNYGDELIERINEEESESITFTMADDNIFIMAALIQLDKPVVITCKTLDPFWVIHDLEHAYSDVSFDDE